MAAPDACYNNLTQSEIRLNTSALGLGRRKTKNCLGRAPETVCETLQRESECEIGPLTVNMDYIIEVRSTYTNEIGCLFV